MDFSFLYTVYTTWLHYVFKPRDDKSKESKSTYKPFSTDYSS